MRSRDEMAKRSSHDEEQARRLKRKGRLLMASQLPIQAGGVATAVGALAAVAAPGIAILPVVAVMAVGFAAVPVAMNISHRVGKAGVDAFNRARRIEGASAPQQPLSDGRPFVLYLRSFADDADTHRHHNFRMELPTAGEEQRLTDAFAPVGPMIAIEDPRNDLPQLGARRQYVGTADWQAHVATLIDGAALVVFRAGEVSPGLAWEIRTAVARVGPRRVIVFVGGEHKSTYERFMTGAADLFPRGLPEARTGRKHNFEDWAFIYFEPDWSPRIEPAGRDIWGGDLLMRSVRKVADKLGMPLID